ncbi:MAG: hypothetical protein ACREEM_45240 [Blastocatellia bacterium]
MQRELILSLMSLLAIFDGGASAQTARENSGSARQQTRQQSGQRAEQAPKQNSAGAEDSTISILSSETRFGLSVVKGVPYSAEAITENVQVLNDGARLTTKATALLYRDSEGRLRREQEFSAIGPFATAGEPVRMIFISDPVARVTYRLDPRARSAIKTAFNSGPSPASPNAPASATRKIESLGKRMIEGVEAEGRRSTLTIPAGQIGNDRPLEIISEKWYSHELKIVVLSKHSDPRLGENTYRVINIKRDEPDAALFRTPADYKIREGNYAPGPGSHSPARERKPE